MMEKEIEEQKMNKIWDSFIKLMKLEQEMKEII